MKVYLSIRDISSENGALFRLVYKVYLVYLRFKKYTRVYKAFCLSIWYLVYKVEILVYQVYCSPEWFKNATLQIFTAQLQPKYRQKAVIWFELQSVAVHCQWHQLLQPKYDFPHSLQLIQATVETLWKSLRIATFGCNENQKSLWIHIYTYYSRSPVKRNMNC